jgi:hypothetical protein
MAQFDNVFFELLGENEGVRDWQGLQILATFDNNNNQPNITTSELTFVKPMGTKLIEYIDNGANGIGNGLFEGVDFKMSIDTPNTGVFDGIVDLSDDIEINRDIDEVKAKLLKLDGLNTFANVSEAITMTLLESEGVFSQSDYVDIEYVKETPFDFISTAILSITIYQLIDNLQRLIKETGDILGDSGGEAIGGATGFAGSAFISAAKIALKTAYIAVISYQLLQTVEEVFNIIYPIKKYHKGIKLKTILEKGCAFAGYTYANSITELDNLYYLPRTTQEGTISKSTTRSGLPQSGDPIYTLGRVVGLVKDLFYAKVNITNGEVQIVPLKNESFWKRQSNYQMRDVKVDIEKYNTAELKPTKLYSFSTDNNDYWTLNDYKGTVYEVKTEPKSYSDFRKVTMKGVEELEFPVALGSRKGGLSVLEEILKAFGSVADSILDWFFFSTEFEQKVIDRTGLLRMSSDTVAVPKLLKLNSNLRLSPNVRDSWSAKYLYDNYHYYNSFVLNNFGQQYKIFEKVKMDASFQDFLDILDSNIGTDAEGNEVEFLSILYNFGGGFWEADYKIKYVYTKNLKETYNEPE